MGRVFAVVVTYRRPQQLARVLGGLVEQSLSPNQILVVDNAADPLVASLCNRYGSVSYLGMTENTGPAGAMSRAMEVFASDYGPKDWLLRLDDDRAPPDDMLIHDLVLFGEHLRNSRLTLGGVGTAGALWDARRGELVAAPLVSHQPGTTVDYLATGFFPLWNGEAILSVGPMDANLFFGLEEVEYGLRLRQRGYELWLHGPRTTARRDLAARGGEKSRVMSRRELGPVDWRRYYSLRNAIVLSRRYGSNLLAVKVSLTRGIAKPLYHLAAEPHLAIQHLRIGLRAVVDAWTGRLGMRIDPGEWETARQTLDAFGERPAT